MPPTRASWTELSPARATLVAQLVQSAAGLICASLVMAFSDSATFGAYALAQAAALLALGVVDSACLVPLLVLCARDGKEGALPRLRAYDGTVLLASALTVVLVASAFAALLPLLLADGPSRHGLALAAGLWGAGMVLRLWLRQRQLLAQRLHALVVLEIAASTLAILVVAGVVMLRRQDALPITAADMAMASASIGILPLGVLMLDAAIRLTPWAFAWRPLMQSGGWSLAAAQITWVQSQTYLYIVSAVLGASAAGVVAAVRMVFMPVQTVLAGLARGWLSELAHAVKADFAARASRLFRRAAPGLLVGASLWALLVLLAADLFQGALAARGYQFNAPLVAAWAAVVVLAGLRTIVTQVLRATVGGFRMLTAQGLVGAFISVVAVGLGATVAGTSGAVAGLALAEGAAFAMGLRSSRLVSRSE